MDGEPRIKPGSSYLEHYLSGFSDVLTDPLMVEMAINPDGSVWVLRRGDVFMQPTGQTVKAGEARRLTEQIAGKNQTQVGRDKLLVGASIEYRKRPIRAQCVLAPATAGDDGAVSFRLFSSLPLDEIRLKYLHGKPVSLSEQRRQRNLKLQEIIASSTLEQALRFCVMQRLNIVISGGTDTGKSVALRKIISMIPKEERIVTIEDAQELYPTQPNTVSLIADRFGESRTTDQLLEATLRMRPDRIIVGEVRGKEAMTFLEAINTGHGGSMTTLHAETPELALDRLAMSAGRANVPMSYGDIREYIFRSIDVVVQAGKLEELRGIAEIFVPGTRENDR